MSQAASANHRLFDAFLFAHRHPLWNMAAATSARPAAERDTIVLFPGRDLMTVSLSELADCQFQGEASASLIEVSALNDLRCEGTRWHTGATNVEKLIYHLKRLVVELASQEADGNQAASDIFPTSPLQEGFVSFSGKVWQICVLRCPTWKGASSI